MTYDELLQEINRKDTTFGSTGRELSYYDKINHALYAVAELHKPNHCSHGVGCFECDKQCAGGYPCPTIQAIEKKLI